MTAIKWLPISEMPAELGTAFFHCRGWDSWVIGHKKADGKWYAAFGLVQPEMQFSGNEHFIPGNVIPPLDAFQDGKDLTTC